MKELDELIDSREKISQKKISITRLERRISDSQDEIKKILKSDMARLIRRIEIQEELEGLITITGWKLAYPLQQDKNHMKITFLWRVNEELLIGKFLKIHKSLKQIVRPYFDKAYPEGVRLIIKEMVDKYNILFSFELRD